MVTVSGYLPEVLDTGDGAEGSAARVGRLQEKVTHHLRVVVHGRTRHAEGHWDRQGIHSVDMFSQKLYLL